MSYSSQVSKKSCNNIIGPNNQFHSEELAEASMWVLLNPLFILTNSKIEG